MLLCERRTLQLTLNILFMCGREKRQSRNSAIKVLDYAMTGVEGAELCQKFVDILGLRTIFPIFMKTPKVRMLVFQPIVCNMSELNDLYLL